MKVHFIYPYVGTLYYAGVHHGLAYISSLLKQHGHHVSLHYVQKEPSRNEILDVIQREHPDLVGFSSTTNQIQYVDLWSRWIKQEFNIPIVCGGVHATLLPEEVISFDGVDMVCLGEGEYPMLELADGSMPVDTIKNLWVKRGDQVIRNELRSLIDPLDALPYPDYDLFDTKRILKERGGGFAILASRGCPFNCSYCCNHALSEVQRGRGRRFRLRSVDNLLLEIELLVTKYGAKRLDFADDVFGLSREWAIEFCKKYPAKFNMEFECNARVDKLDNDLLENLKSANCSQINLGIESGSEWLRREVLKRNMSNQDIVRTFDMIHSLGIRTRSYNMIGLPYETPQMVEETINLNKRVKPDHIAVFYFYPYPKTELWEICKREGFLTDKHSTSYVGESILALPTISSKELDNLYTKFYRYAIEREIRSYHPLLRFPFRIINFVLTKFLNKRGIKLLMKIQLRYFEFFSLLKRANKQAGNKETFERG